MHVLLWLNCEGWTRFGPFRWLRFGNDPLCVLFYVGSAGSESGGRRSPAGTLAGQV